MKWQPIEMAPKGEWVERPGPKGSTIRVHMPVRIIALMSNGAWTVSHWMADAERWCMFTKECPPEAWCMPPEPPEPTP